MVEGSNQSETIVKNLKGIHEVENVHDIYLHNLDKGCGQDFPCELLTHLHG